MSPEPKHTPHPRPNLRHPAPASLDVFPAALPERAHAVAAWDCFGFVRPALVCAPDPAARRLELHLLRLGNHVQHRYFPAFGCGADGVAGPFQDAVSPSFDPVDILCYAAFGRHQEACPASSPPTSVQPQGKGRLAARAAAAPVFVSGHPLQAGKRLFGFVRIPHYVWRSDTA